MAQVPITFHINDLVGYALAMERDNLQNAENLKIHAVRKLQATEADIAKLKGKITAYEEFLRVYETA